MVSSINPCLRDFIDIQLIKHQDEQIILLTCKLGISEPLALISAVGPILMKLDGCSSLVEIKDHFLSLNVSSDIIDRVIDLLDTNFYLAGNNFHQKKQLALDQFRAASVRAAAHAGRVYASDPNELTSYLNSLFSNSGLDSSQTPSGELAVLVAPHIDYNRGSSGYAKAYKQLENYRPDICLLMGTSHQPGKSLFQLCSKDFDCPNGLLKVEKDFVDALAKGYGEERAFKDELLHRQEHSLELQLPFLNHFCPQTKIVPILVGSFYQFLRADGNPDSDQEYVDFVNCLSETYQQFKRNGASISIIAGVDMAHMGQNFGDKFLLDQSKLKEIEKEDHEYLSRLCSLSASNLLSHIKKDHDQRRICGFPTMHTILDLLAKQEKNYSAQMIEYKQAVNLETQCLVSFAAMGIYESL